jgi:hypothetical protein
MQVPNRILPNLLTQDNFYIHIWMN